MHSPANGAARFPLFQIPGAELPYGRSRHVTVATIEAVSFAQVIAIGIYPLQMTGDGLLANYRRINKSGIEAE